MRRLAPIGLALLGLLLAAGAVGGPARSLLSVYLERDLGDAKSDRANLPDDVPPDELTLEMAEEL